MYVGIAIFEWEGFMLCQIMDWRNAAISMDVEGSIGQRERSLGRRPQGNRPVLFGKPHFTMPSIESAYLNLNLYAYNTNPNFQRNVIEKMMEISKKMQNS